MEKGFSNNKPPNRFVVTSFLKALKIVVNSNYIFEIISLNKYKYLALLNRHSNSLDKCVNVFDLSVFKCGEM